MASKNPEFPQDTDENLWFLAVHGDAQAEESLIARYHRTVRACARPLFLAGGDHEDLLQEGLLGLLSAIRRYDPAAGPFKPFAEVCIRARLRSAVRAAGREKHKILNTSVPLTGVEETLRHDPEALLIEREGARERVDQLKDQLSPFESQVLHCYLNGLSYHEIAKATDKPPKSVDNAVQRIRKKLTRP